MERAVSLKNLPRACRPFESGELGVGKAITMVVNTVGYLKQIYQGQGPLQVLGKKERPFDVGNRSEGCGR